MRFNWNPVYIVNLILCTIILVLGCLGYNKSRNRASLFVGIAFGIFGISYIIALFDLGKTPTSILIIIRILAYLIVICALYRVVDER